MNDFTHVSMWAGLVSSPEELDHYLEFEYTEDGDSIPSPFCRAFGIDWFDEDYREAWVTPRATMSVSELLAGASFEQAVVAAVSGVIGAELPLVANAVVLIHDFRYDGQAESATLPGFAMRFIGVFRYERS